MIVRVVTYLGIFGIPSIFAMVMFCVKECATCKRKFDILMRAIKSQMRAQLLKDYEYHIEQGYIDDVHMREWQNQYLCYHELVGENGVLDDRYKKLLALPNSL